MDRRKVVLYNLFLCFFLLVPALPGYCQAKPSCAVLMLHADEASADIYEFESSTLTQKFTEVLPKFGVYQTLDYNEMNKILTQKEGGALKTCKLKGCAVRYGAALNVEYVIYGVFGHVGSMYSIETNLVEVKTGKLVQQVTTDYEGDRKGFAEKVPVENLKSLLGVSELPPGTEIATGQIEKTPKGSTAEGGSAEGKKFHVGPRIGIGASDDGVEFGGGLEFRYTNLGVSILGNDAGFSGGLLYYLHAEGNSPYLSMVGIYYDTENNGTDETGKIYGLLAGYRVMLGHGLDVNFGIGAGYVDWHQTEDDKNGNRQSDTEIIPIGELTFGYLF